MDSPPRAFSSLRVPVAVLQQASAAPLAPGSPQRTREMVMTHLANAWTAALGRVRNGPRRTHIPMALSSEPTTLPLSRSSTASVSSSDSDSIEQPPQLAQQPSVRPLTRWQSRRWPLRGASAPALLQQQQQQPAPVVEEQEAQEGPALAFLQAILLQQKQPPQPHAQQQQTANRPFWPRPRGGRVAPTTPQLQPHQQPQPSISVEASQQLLHALQEVHITRVKHSILARLLPPSKDASPPALHCFPTTMGPGEYTPAELARAALAASGATRAFYAVDLGRVVRQACLWRLHHALGAGAVEPRFAVGSLADPVLLKALAALGVRLNCGARADMLAMTEATPSSWEDTKPCKTPAHLNAALRAGCRALAVDSPEEVARVAGKARALGIEASGLALVVHLRAPLHKGFALGLLPDALPALLSSARAKGLAGVRGLSLDLRQWASHDTAVEGQLRAALQHARAALEAIVASGAAAPGPAALHVHLLGVDRALLGSLLLPATVKEVLGPLGVFVSVDASAHLLEGAVSLVTRVIGKRAVSGAQTQGQHQGWHYYLDDGCYGSLGDVVLHRRKLVPVPLSPITGTGSTVLWPTTLWGPTCDGLDCVDKLTAMPELEVGDWVGFLNVGGILPSFAAGRTMFNGLPGPNAVHCFSGVGAASAQGVGAW